MITQEELQALSVQLAPLYGVKAYTFSAVECYPPFNLDDAIWLHDDWATLMDLAVENKLEPSFNGDSYISVKAFSKKFDDGYGTLSRESYEDHTDPKQATRVAIMKALIAVKGE